MRTSDVFKVLIVDDEPQYQDVFKMLLDGRDYYLDTAASGEEALQKMERQHFHLVLTDLIMSGMDGLELLEKIKQCYKDVDVIMITGYGSVESAVAAMKKGAFSYFIKSSNPALLLAEIDKLERLFKVKNSAAKTVSTSVKTNFMLQSHNHTVLRLMDIIEKAAATNVNILITGESGTGKEVFACYIHEKSLRSQNKFVPVNCQALSENLLESELFGHEKGAFTGANERRIGRFEEASGGTLFMDQIGEMPVGTQVKLLRVLETRKIERIGSNASIAVDLRLISATNCNIHTAIKDGAFREDLFYRINTIILELPSLRERKEDLSYLINFFLNKYQTEYQKPISGMEQGVKDFLLNHTYPGNIRELKNIMERLVVLSENGMLRTNDLPCLESSDSISTEEFSAIKPLRELKREVEKKYISCVLQKFNGNITEAAKHLGLSRRQIFNKVVEYNLKY